MVKLKNTKAILYVLVLLAVFISPAAAQTISVASQSAGPGGNVTVPIMAINITNVAAYSLTLSYDSSVVVVDDVTAGALGDPYWNNIAPGTTTISAFSTTEHTGYVILANVVLRAVGEPGDTSPLVITVTEIVDSNGVAIPVTPAPGTFSITGAPSVGTLAGIVTDASSSAPIAGATVTAADGTFSTTTETNVNGSYTISIAAGTYTVSANATGYVSNSTSVTVTSGATVTQDFALTPVIVPVNGTVVGTVTNATGGSPISGATIDLDDALSTTTSAIGYYIINNVAAGSHTVKAAASGYTNATATVVVQAGLTATVDIALTPVSTIFDPGDANQDHVIDIDELMTVIGLWKAGSYSMDDLMTSIARWKAGSY